MKFFKTIKPRGFFFSFKLGSLAVKLNMKLRVKQERLPSCSLYHHPPLYCFTSLHDCSQVGKRSILGKKIWHLVSMV